MWRPGEQLIRRNMCHLVIVTGSNNLVHKALSSQEGHSLPAGERIEPTLFVRLESEGQRSEGSTPSFMGQGLGMRPPKRTLSELGVPLSPCSEVWPVCTSHWCSAGCPASCLHAASFKRSAVVIMKMWVMVSMGARIAIHSKRAPSARRRCVKQPGHSERIHCFRHRRS